MAKNTNLTINWNNKRIFIKPYAPALFIMNGEWLYFISKTVTGISKYASVYKLAVDMMENEFIEVQLTYLLKQALWDIRYELVY